MNAIRFRDFGAEMRRPFEVDENCFDCAAFYEGCKGWPANKPMKPPGSNRLLCTKYDRLPDVRAGTCGQTFPPARHKAQAHHAPADIDQQPVSPAPEPVEEQPDAATGTSTDGPGEQTPRGDRRCRCGAPLPKGKRLCDSCRTHARHETKRAYMRGYMGERRSGPIHADPDMPFPDARRPAVDESADDLPQTLPVDTPPTDFEQLY